MILTVAVPTYDRNEVLLANLARLLPQLTPEVGLLVLDNHSPRPVEPDLAPLLAAHPHAGVRVVRHACNVGGNANIMRCFELATTPWVWVLGDDDAVKPDALATVLAQIAEDPDAAFVHFFMPDVGCPDRPKTIRSEGLDEFLERIDAFGAMTFISNCLYRRDKLVPFLRWGYQFSYSNLPHVALVLSALAAGERAVLSPIPILGEISLADVGARYSTVYLSIGFSTVLELPTLSLAHRRAVATKLAEVLVLLYRPTLYDLLDRLEGDQANCRQQHRLVVERGRNADRVFAWRPLVLLGRLLLGIPALGRAAIRLHHRRKKTSARKIAPNASMERF